MNTPTPEVINLTQSRDNLQREAYYLRKDLCEIAAAFEVGVPDSTEAKKRIIAVKDECTELRAEVERLKLSPQTLENAVRWEDCERMRARAERAEAELAAERARLDWLDLTATAILLAPRDRRLDVNSTDVRAAIDAAMKESHA